jgi:hypothetical protein
MQGYDDFLTSCSLQIKNNVHEIISCIHGIINKSCGTSKIILYGSCRRFMEVSRKNILKMELAKITKAFGTLSY